VTEPEHFHDGDARAAWNQAAEAWEDFVESGKDYYRDEIHGPALLAVCEPLSGLRVLDLGCGQGYFTRQLAKRGAHVVGVDIADEMLALARQHEKEDPLGIEYRQMSAAEVHRRWPTGSFDLVAGLMSLHDMAEPETVLRSAYAALKPAGRMAFVIPHPATDTPYREWEVDKNGTRGALKINHYFESGPTVLHWTMKRLIYHWDTPYWRHTLTEWSEMIAASGFLIRRIYEPRPTPEQVRHNPHVEDAFRLPYALLFELVKPAVQLGLPSA